MFLCANILIFLTFLTKIARKHGNFAKKSKKSDFFVRHIENRPIFAASNQNFFFE